MSSNKIVSEISFIGFMLLLTLVTQCSSCAYYGDIASELRKLNKNMQELNIILKSKQ